MDDDDTCTLFDDEIGRYFHMEENMREEHVRRERELDSVRRLLEAQWDSMNKMKRCIQKVEEACMSSHVYLRYKAAPPCDKLTYGDASKKFDESTWKLLVKAEDEYERANPFFYRSGFAELKDFHTDILEDLELLDGSRRIRQNIVELRQLFNLHSEFYRFVKLCSSCLPINGDHGYPLPSELSSVVQGGFEPLTNTIMIPFSVKGRRVVVKVSIANHPSKSIVCIHQGARKYFVQRHKGRFHDSQKEFEDHLMLEETCHILQHMAHYRLHTFPVVIENVAFSLCGRKFMPV